MDVICGRDTAHKFVCYLQCGTQDSAVIYVLLDDKLIPWKVNITKLMAHNKCMNLINSVTNTRVHNTGSNYDKVKYMLQIII